MSHTLSLETLQLVTYSLVEENESNRGRERWLDERTTDTTESGGLVSGATVTGPGEDEEPWQGRWGSG